MLPAQLCVVWTLRLALLCVQGWPKTSRGPSQPKLLFAQGWGHFLFAELGFLGSNCSHLTARHITQNFIKVPRNPGHLYSIIHLQKSSDVESEDNALAICFRNKAASAIPLCEEIAKILTSVTQTHENPDSSGSGEPTTLS